MAVFLAEICAQSFKKNLSPRNFHRMTSHADVNHSVIRTGGAHKNPAGPAHLDALLNQHALLRPGDSVRHHPGSGAAGG